MRHIQLAVLICSLCILCNAIDDKKKCTPYRTCADCIVKGGGDCYYCADEDFQKTNTRQPRCNTMVELTKANCKSISPEKTDLAVTKNDSLTDTNQVQPQQVTLKLRVGQPAKFKIKVKPTKNYPVDLYYLMDLSNSMKDDKGNLTRLAEDLAAAIGKITTNYRLGFGSFVDKPVAPYIRLDLKNEPCEECAATFGFKHSMTFQKDVKLFKDAVEKQKISSNLDSPEGGFDALMQASVCKNEIGWKNVDEARRIIIFVTDAYPHIAGDGRLGGIITPNDGQCHMSNGKYTKSETMDYPSIAFLASKMKEHKILPIIATTSEVMNVYSKISEEWKDIGAVAAELKGDSSNIVELVKDAYTKISQTVRVTTNDAPADIKVTAESNCGGGDGSDTCTNVRPGEDDVEFDISVTAQIRLCENGAKGDKKDFTINVAGFGEVKVNYEAICECDCKSKGVPKSPKCTNRGTYACGICYCDEGRFGPTCNCTDATAADNTLCMLNATDPNEKVCSGFGRCICGKCECDKDDANPEHVISGTYCQCNNFGCELHRGLLCGGPDRGQCECGKCRCAGDYVGTNCGSRNCTIAAKDCIKDGKVCSGNGKCGCGKCVCDTGYNGNHCERCVSCPGKCKTVRDCVLCQAFSGEGVEPKSICDTCNLNLKFVNQSEECSIQVNATCYVQYHFENDLTKLVNETIFVQREKRCLIVKEKKVNILAIILGTIGGIVLLGLLLLLLWKLLITAYDNYEYHKFEKDRMKSKWEQAENPIYRPSKQQFKNPAYAGAQ